MPPHIKHTQQNHLAYTVACLCLGIYMDCGRAFHHPTTIIWRVSPGSVGSHPTSAYLDQRSWLNPHPLTLLLTALLRLRHLRHQLPFLAAGIRVFLGSPTRTSKPEMFLPLPPKVTILVCCQSRGTGFSGNLVDSRLPLHPRIPRSPPWPRRVDQPRPVPGAESTRQPGYKTFVH